MSKRLVMSIVMAFALVLAGGSYFSAQAMGDWSKRDMDKWKQEPMTYYSHSGAPPDYGLTFPNAYAGDNAKNSVPLHLTPNDRDH